MTFQSGRANELDEQSLTQTSVVDVIVSDLSWSINLIATGIQSDWTQKWLIVNIRIYIFVYILAINLKAHAFLHECDGDTDHADHADVCSTAPPSRFTHVQII